MSSSSRHPKRPIRSPDPRDLPSVGPSSASRHGNRDFEMRRHPPNSFWDTVINHSDDDHHRSRPISKQPRECPDCRRSFSSSRWEEHRATCPAINEKPYECKECGTSFKKNSNLEKHKRLVHRGEKTSLVMNLVAVACLARSQISTVTSRQFISVKNPLYVRRVDVREGSPKRAD